MIRLCWVLCLGAPLAAQQVELQIKEETGSAPVAGAIVRLLGDRGVAAQGLSNELGRITLRAPAAGSYRIKIDRIGWSGLITAPFPLAAGDTYRRELLMAARRTELPPLTVHGKSKCEREGQGGELATALWEEIGKALTANVVTNRQKAVQLHVRQFVRELDQRERPVREWVAVSTLIRGHPFPALPPGALAKLGFVYEEDDSVVYAAPDAALLLSEEFVGTHCFRAVPGKEGRVGLAFEPASGRKVADVKGILWLDRATSELQFLEYAFTGLPGILSRAALGGRVEFQRLASGAWIVRYWYVRMPALREVEIRTAGNVATKTALLAGYIDQGGRAEVAADGAGSTDRSLLVGRVFDSLTGHGLANAVIRVDGYRDSVLTDGGGQFVLAVQAAGDQVVRVVHPKTGLFRDGASRPALLSLGDTTRVEFAVSSLETLTGTFCGKVSRGRSGVFGMAWNSDGTPARGLDVRIKWMTSSGGTREEHQYLESEGMFAFCNLPPDRTLPIRLVDRLRALSEVPVKLEWGQFRFVELRPPP